MGRAEIPPLERFLANARAIAVNRSFKADYRLYDRFKNELVRDYPMLSPRDYTQAVGVLAKICGV